jgi:DNA-binding response OmpR family regulator
VSQIPVRPPSEGEVHDLSDVKILIVEDDPDVAQAMEEYFTYHHAHVEWASDGVEGLTMMQSHPDYDIVLLDVSMPKKDGFEVLKDSQELGLTMPVLMVTARGEKENILRGFGLGVEDYVIKPFDAEDLMRRVEAILGHHKAAAQAPMQSVQLGDVLIDFEKEVVLRNGYALDFSELEFELLKALVENRGRVVTRPRLLRLAWGIDQENMAFTVSTEVVAQTVDEHIEAIARKLQPVETGPPLIESVYGLGYRFTG